MGSGLRHVMEVPQDHGPNWLCDVRTDGAYAGTRIATKLKPNNEILTQLEWADREGDDMYEEHNQGLLIVLNGPGTESVPRKVLEWLMNGQPSVEKDEMDVLLDQMGY